MSLCFPGGVSAGIVTVALASAVTTSGALSVSSMWICTKTAVSASPDGGSSSGATSTASSTVDVDGDGLALLDVVGVDVGVEVHLGVVDVENVVVHVAADERQTQPARARIGAEK